MLVRLADTWSGSWTEGGGSQAWTEEEEPAQNPGQLAFGNPWMLHVKGVQRKARSNKISNAENANVWPARTLAMRIKGTTG